MNDAIEVLPMRPADWPGAAEIYAEGIATGIATFETEVPTWERWDETHLPEPRLVARRGTDLAGWAALSAVSGRRVYAGVAECSIYVAERERGSGVGTRLLAALVERSERAGIWTIQAGIFRENAASIALHARSGFRVVGIREQLARRDGVWRDVVLMERRSAIVG